jgi:hypothetical protein
MIIPLSTATLTEEQLDVAREIAMSEVCDVATNMEIFAESLQRTYLFKDFDLMKCFYNYLKEHDISISGTGFDDNRLQELFFHYHAIGTGEK